MSNGQRRVTLELLEILEVHCVPQMDIFLVGAAEALCVVLVEGYSVDGIVWYFRSLLINLDSLRS